MMIRAEENEGQAVLGDGDIEKMMGKASIQLARVRNIQIVGSRMTSSVL